MTSAAENSESGRIRVAPSTAIELVPLLDSTEQENEAAVLKRLVGPRPYPVGTINYNSLLDIVHAYVTRTTCEDVNALEQAGSTPQLLWDLNVIPTNGLNDKNELDIETRRKQGGSNSMPKKELTPFYKMVWAASEDFMLRILMLAAILSLTLGLAFAENKKVEWIEGAAILFAVLIVILVTAVNDYLKEKQFANLFEQEEKFCNCIRGGELIKLNMQELVVGDIIQLETGDEIPADALIISAHELKVDESSLTGETDAVSKATIEECSKEKISRLDEISAVEEAAKEGESRTGHHIIASPIVLSGSAVTAGTARAIVVAVGLRSTMGKLFSKLAVDTEPTPLQNKLNALARDVGKAGLIAAAITLLALVLEYWITYAVKKDARESGTASVRAMVEYLITAITIVVVAVPEGLPLAVTISLAFSVGRMLKDQNFVRRLAACETMGGANEICSDKTGTLTKNIMEVEAFWNGSALQYNIATLPIAEIPLPSGEHRTILAHNMAVNSTGYLETSEVEIGDGSGNKKTVIKQVGSPTECAMLQFLTLIGYNYDAIRKMFSGRKIETLDAASAKMYESSPPEQELIQCKIPFSSDRKAMSTIVKHPSDPNLLRIFTKGASEVVLRRCAFRVDSEGTLKALPEQKLQKIEDAIILQLAASALRTICIAYKDFNPSEHPDWDTADPTNPLFQKVETELICLGIAGIRDPVREEVPAAVKKCQAAGIKVRMCTGDNLETAKQIAIQSNIFHPEKGGLAMLGPEFLKLVGGVVCENCQTEICPCQTGEKKVEDEADAEEKPAEPGCCGCMRRKSNRNNDGTKSRVDVLGDPIAFDRIADRLEVLARSQPNDKYALVTGLKNRGAIVAVTGDGSNDAPALKKADVGFAMGITGKEVAKQAADIVLLDDNFESIVKACKWGRNIYDNIQRFLQFQLTVNVVAVITAFVGSVILRGSPLSAVQLLWVNLIMDTFAALALATELPTDKLLDRPPNSRTEYLVNSVRQIFSCSTLR